jgi:hypothetical protein
MAFIAKNLDKKIKTEKKPTKKETVLTKKPPEKWVLTKNVPEKTDSEKKQLEKTVLIPEIIEPEKTIEQNTLVEKKKSETVETIHFFRGADKLSIVLVKKDNRMYRTQIFLNDVVEIRNATYTGASMAYAFWNLLKANLKINTNEGEK